MTLPDGCLRVVCPACGASMGISAAKIPVKGAWGKCPKCQGKVFIQSPGSKTAVPEPKPTPSVPANRPSRKVETPASPSCPRCGKAQGGGDACMHCGIVIRKFLGQKEASPEPADPADPALKEKFDRARACFERGQPCDLVDVLGNIVSIQSKLFLLSPRIDSHYISTEVEARMTEFIMRHDLYDVKVRLNQFAPEDELKRLSTAAIIHPVARFLFGLFCVVGYLLNPGRLFGGDFYQPVTNSVNLFSDHVAVALHELGHALDFKSRKHPTLYQLTRFIPFVALYQEWKASCYAVQFLKEQGYREEELEAYKILYPAYSTYVIGAAYEFIPSPIAVFVTLPVIALGHVVGRVHAWRRNKELSTGPRRKKSEISEARALIDRELPKTEHTLDIAAAIAIVFGAIMGFILHQGVWGALGGGLAAYGAYQVFLNFRNKRKAAGQAA